MKIEELPHTEITRYSGKLESWATNERVKLMERFGYVPVFDAMAGDYSIISKLLDKDCVIAYYTDNSQTTFLIKTSRKYVSFICLSDRLKKYLGSFTTRRITRIETWSDSKDRFIEYLEDEDLIIVDKDLWDKYFKTKLLEKLE